MEEERGLHELETNFELFLFGNRMTPHRYEEEGFGEFYDRTFLPWQARRTEPQLDVGATETPKAPLVEAACVVEKDIDEDTKPRRDHRSSPRRAKPAPRDAPRLPEPTPIPILRRRTVVVGNLQTLHRVRPEAAYGGLALRSCCGAYEHNNRCNQEAISRRELMPCPLCKRPAEGHMEKHHLRTRRTDKDESEFLCRECHQILHGLFSNRELRDTHLQLDSVEGLLANERFAKALPFIQKLPVGTALRMRLSNHARGGKRRWNG